jgi:hypothetical protein
LFFIFCLSSTVLAQKNYNLNSIIYDANVSTNVLTTPELAKYNLYSDTLYSKNAYIVKFRDIEAEQEDGGLIIKLPWDTMTAYFIARDVEIFNDGYFWHGHVKFDTMTMDTLMHHEIGSFLLLKKDSAYVGFMNLDTISYNIRHLGRDYYVMTEYNIENNAYECYAMTPDSIDSATYYTGEQDSIAVAAQVRSCPIRVLALYTEAARDAIGGNQAAEFEIMLAIQKTNAAFKNSAITPNGASIVLAGIEFYDEFVETNNIDADQEYRSNLIPLIEDPFSELSILRDQVQADIVVVFTNGVWTNNVGGVAFVGPIAEQAAAIVQIRNANANFTAAHEIGHLLGCRHQVFSDVNGEFEHAYTFRAGQSMWFNKFRETILYSPHSNKRILHYSNPRVRFMGRKTGTFADEDNARMISERGCIVGSFRTGGDNSLSGYILGPHVSCHCNFVGVQAIVNSLEPVTYSYAWEISYDGFNYTQLFETTSYLSVQIPCLDEIYGYPVAEGIFIRVTITASDNSTITLSKYIEASATMDDQGLPCMLSLINNIEEVNELKIQVYPQPATDMLYLQLPPEIQNNKIGMALYDLKGKRIQNYIFEEVQSTSPVSIGFN